jgi:hypothetical protein
MAFNEQLAERVRASMAAHAPFDERRMFGGISFLVGGNFACGVMNDDLLVRFDPASEDDLMARPHARPFEMGGRTSNGWLLVAPEGTKAKRDFERWVGVGVAYASSLPAKDADKPSTATRRRGGSRAR